MIIMLKKGLLLCALALATLSQSVIAEDLRIIGEEKRFVATLPSGDSITITVDWMIERKGTTFTTA